MRNSEPDPLLADDLEAAKRALVKVGQQQQRLVRQYTEATHDGFPWELVQLEVSRLEGQKTQLEFTIRDPEARISAAAAGAQQVEEFMAHFARIRENVRANLQSPSPECKWQILLQRL